MDLAPADALTLRLASLLLRPAPGAPRPADVAGVTEWLGALQAQDYASVLWSLGVRLPGMTVTDVVTALEGREALRTWPMRGTVHLVPSRDARWMLDVLGPRVLSRAAARRASLGLTAEIADRAADVLGAALAGGGRLTRSQCLAALEAAGIEVTGQRGYHLLWYASQLGVTCIAPNIGKEQSFVLLDEWVPDPHRPDRDEALGTIALRYFRGHGPATRQDFAGWTGLTMADAKRGIAVAAEALTVVTVEGREMVVERARLDELPAVRAAVPPPDGDVLALPGFDEYLLGFKDRSLMLAPGDLDAIIPGGNGVFRPTIVRDGRVVATWTRTTASGRTLVDVRPLAVIGAGDRPRVERALEAYGRFTGTAIEVRWP